MWKVSRASGSDRWENGDESASWEKGGGLWGGEQGRDLNLGRLSLRQDIPVET